MRRKKDVKITTCQIRSFGPRGSSHMCGTDESWRKKVKELMMKYLFPQPHQEFVIEVCQMFHGQPPKELQTFMFPHGRAIA